MLPEQYRYAVYGLTLACDAPLETPLHPGHGAADVAVERLAAPRLSLEAINALAPLIQSRIENADGEPAFRLARLEDGTLLFHFNRVLDVYVKGARVAYVVREIGYEYLAEIALLGPVSALLLGQRGTAVLHASAVGLPTGAALFLADSRAGKSTLASSLLRAGHRHLSDDMAALRVGERGVAVEPGYPQLRLWPDSAALVGLDAAAWPRVLAHQSKVRVPVGGRGLGRAEGEAQPVAAIYLPERGAPGSEIAIEPVRGSMAIVRLLEQLMGADLLRATGTPLPIEALDEAVRRVPVRRLRYPSGFERLPEVHAALLADTAATAS